jgi:hypothetical protein
VGPASLYRREVGLPFEGFVQGFNHLSFMNVPCHYYPIPNTSHLPPPQSSTTTTTTTAAGSASATTASVGGRGGHRPAPLPDSAAGFAELFAAIADEVGAISSILSASGAWSTFTPACCVHCGVVRATDLTTGTWLPTGVKAETNVGTALELAVLHRRQKFLESKGHALHVAASNLGLAVPPSTSAASASSVPATAAARYDYVCGHKGTLSSHGLTDICTCVWRL